MSPIRGGDVYLQYNNIPFSNLGSDCVPSISSINTIITTSNVTMYTLYTCICCQKRNWEYEQKINPGSKLNNLLWFWFNQKVSTAKCNF